MVAQLLTSMIVPAKTTTASLLVKSHSRLHYLTVLLSVCRPPTLANLPPTLPALPVQSTQETAEKGWFAVAVAARLPP